jgi:hypothetical protein
MENAMDNSQTGKPVQAPETDKLLKQRLDQLLLQRGNVTYRIETLKAELTEIDDELDGYNIAVPFMRIVEQVITRKTEDIRNE